MRRFAVALENAEKRAYQSDEAENLLWMAPVSGAIQTLRKSITQDNRSVLLVCGRLRPPIIILRRGL